MARVACDQCYKQRLVCFEMSTMLSLLTFTNLHLHGIEFAPGITSVELMSDNPERLLVVQLHSWLHKLAQDTVHGSGR